MASVKNCRALSPLDRSCTVSIKREAASQYGLTAATIGSAVRSALTGETATSVMINNVSLDVVVRGDGTAAASLDALRSMPVPTPMGTYVPLGSVANVEIIQAPQTIHRVDQSRQVSVTGSTLSGNVTGMTAEINDILDSYQFPEGYHAAISGSYTDMMEGFEDRTSLFRGCLRRARQRLERGLHAA